MWSGDFFQNNIISARRTRCEIMLPHSHQALNLRTRVIVQSSLLRFVHTGGRQRQRKLYFLSFMNRLCGVQWGCSHWGAAMAMAKVTSMATSWNGLDTHLWWQRQRQRQIEGVSTYICIGWCCCHCRCCRHWCPPVWTLATIPLLLPSLNVNKTFTKTARLLSRKNKFTDQIDLPSMQTCLTFNSDKNSFTVSGYICTLFSNLGSIAQNNLNSNDLVSIYW